MVGDGDTGTMPRPGDVQQTMSTKPVNPSNPITDPSSRAFAGMLTGTFGRRRMLLAALAVPGLGAVLAACGDNTQGAGANPTTPTPDPTPETSVPDTSVPDTSVPDTSTDITYGIVHPTGADEVVVRLGLYGGLVPFGMAFQNVPSVLIAGDGRVYTPGITTAVFPGALLPAINVRTIDEAGIQRVLALAADTGLLQPPPDYSADLNIADAPVTQLILNANGSTFTHEAYALGLQDPAETKDRNVLNGVVIQINDLEQLVGAEHLGQDAPLEPEAYRFQARPLTVEELDGYTDPVPTVVSWPDSIGVTLAGATNCAVVPATAVATVFTEATERTFFSDGDGEAATVYQVTAAALLPGDAC